MSLLKYLRKNNRQIRELHIKHENEKYDFIIMKQKLSYIKPYDYVFVGPVPHKVNGLAGEPSIISQVDNHSDIYPYVV